MTCDTIDQKYIYRVPRDLIIHRDLYINYTISNLNQNVSLSLLSSMSETEFLGFCMKLDSNIPIKIINDFNIFAENKIISSFLNDLKIAFEYLLYTNGFHLVR